MRTKGSDNGSDVLDTLASKDREIQQIMDDFFSPRALSDHALRGALGKKLIDRCSVEEAAKEAIYQDRLSGIGREDLARALAEQADERRRLVAELDEISAGVSPRDVHTSEGRRYDESAQRLRYRLSEHLRFEREVVLPVLRELLPREELQRARRDFEKARRRAPTHPGRGGASVRQLNGVTRRIKLVYDWIRDYPPAEGASGSRGGTKAASRAR